MNLVIDCDGVLTDGKVYMDASGKKMFKAFHSHDVRAIREFVARGMRVIIVSASDWAGMPHFASNTGAELLVLRDKGAFPENIPIDFAVGDDTWDVPILERAKHAFHPKDAGEAVRKVPNITELSVYGGCGTVAFLLDYLIRHRILPPF